MVMFIFACPNQPLVQYLKGHAIYSPLSGHWDQTIQLHCESLGVPGSSTRLASGTDREDLVTRSLTARQKEETTSETLPC